MSPEPMPVPLKPVPVTVTLEMVMFAFPVFVTVAGSEALCPGGTVPKFNVAGLTLSKCVAAAPVPLRVIVT